MYKIKKKTIIDTRKDLTAIETKEVKPIPEVETKAKISSHYLNSYFTTEDTLKNYNGQLEFNFKAEGDITDITRAKSSLAVIVSKGFKGLDLSYPENRIMKGIFSLLQKQRANEDQPFIVLDNISLLFEEILEKKVTKTLKGGYSFKDFSGAEVKQANKALETLQKTPQQIIVKGQDGIDKKKKPLYFFYMKETPLITIEYLKRKIPADQVNKITEKQLKETGQVKISILPIFLRDYHKKYYKLLPKDISKEIRAACPEITKISKPLNDFIDLLHRQEKNALINGNELRRNRLTLIKELKLEERYKKRKKRTIDDLLKYYDMAKRTGYLESYKLDQRVSRTYELMDIFYLNIFKYDHLRPKKIEEGRGKTNPVPGH